MMPMSTRLPTADEIYADVAAALPPESQKFRTSNTIRILMDRVNQLSFGTSDEIAAALIEPTISTGDIKWDTLIAASIRYRLRTLGITAPPWTYKPPLPHLWWPFSVSAQQVRAEFLRTPVELWRVGIFLEEKGFSTA